jgi:15-cis-phytoene desaturase
MNTVFVLGGGVAGLTAAHELADRQFDVVVFERHPLCGGKARSMDNKGSGIGGLKDLPAEHGFRFFPGFYFHLTDTMKRIVVDPLTGATADQNLVAAREIAIGQEGKPLFLLQASRPETLQEWIGALRELIEDPSLEIPFAEGRVFLRKVFCFLGAGRQRRLEQYEQTSWWDFIEAELKSDQYKAILARGLSQSLVAMRPDKASTLTVGSMLVQILLNIIRGEHSDRLLSAPTNEAWIDPWTRQLEQNVRVSIHREHTVTAINFDAASNRVTGVTVQDNAGGVSTVGDAGDHYISALPIDVVKSDAVLFPTAFKRAAGLSRPAPGIDDGVDKLDTEWMNGVLFYMNRDVSAAHGHVIYAHSRWALTSISQRQFWRPTFDWAGYDNGQTQDILSTIISDWDTPGNKVAVGKTAKQSTRQEILDETWAQLKAHLSLAGNGTLSDGDRIADFIDPAIQFDAPGPGGKVVGNTEPLLVNTKGSRRHRPSAGTNIPNFYVASDYVATETDLACMEAANEAARQAVNALLLRTGSMQPPCAIQPLREPELFKAFQAVDDLEYPGDPTQPPLLCRLLDLLLPVAGPAPLAPPGVPNWLVLVLLGLNLVVSIAALFALFSR